MGYDTSNYYTDWFDCPWTGERFVNRDQALQLSPNCEGALNSGNRSVLTGQLSEQQGNQIWMNANPTGVMPDLTLEQKMKLTDNGSAEYAAGWLGTLAANKYANIQVSSAVAQIQKFPVSVGTAELWKAVPELYPPVEGTAYNSVNGRPGGEAEPAYVKKFVADEVVNSGNPVGTQSTAGVGSTGTGAVSTVGNAIKDYGMWIVGAIIMIVLLGFLMTSKLGARAGA
jgi:hypothetical protein